MAEVITAIPAYAFPYEVDSIQLRTDANASLLVKIVRNSDSDILLYEKFIADASGIITLEDLATFFIDNMDGVETFNIYGGETLLTAIKLCPFTAMSREKAVSFLNDSFMSLCSIKDTALYLPEIYSFFSTKDETLEVSAYYFDGTSFSTQLFTESITNSTSGINSVDLSAKKFRQVGKELLSYTAKIGERKILFEVTPNQIDCTLSVRFQNSFMQDEYFHFFGLLERDVEFSRKSAFINREINNYSIEETPKIIAHTGMKYYDNTFLMHDLCRSEKIQTILGRKLVVLDQSIKDDGNKYNIADMTVSFRTANRLPFLEDESYQEIFDDTFDNTYN